MKYAMKATAINNAATTPNVIGALSVTSNNKEDIILVSTNAAESGDKRQSTPAPFPAAH
jgi:hypothetical protein